MFLFKDHTDLPVDIQDQLPIEIYRCSETNRSPTLTLSPTLELNQNHDREMSTVLKGPIPDLCQTGDERETGGPVGYIGTMDHFQAPCHPFGMEGGCARPEHDER